MARGNSGYRAKRLCRNSCAESESSRSCFSRGTHESLLDAGQFIATLEHRQGLKVACPEEIAWWQGWIDASQVERLAQPLAKNGYGQYLLRIITENVF